MRKIKTLFKKDPENLARVVDEVNPENHWVIEGNAIATRKYDGTSCAIINGELFKRFDLKKGRTLPEGAIPCQEADEISGHHPHWVKCDRENNADQYHFEAFDQMENKEDGTYELCGEKVQGNPENIEGHALIKHGSTILKIEDYSFEALKAFLTEHDIEGIVFHHKSEDKMCKLRKADFGIAR